MATYITAFIFYTLAMVGILLVGFVVYKKVIVATKSENKGMIQILDSMAIAPKKMLLVVQIKDEKFLIASGAEHTTFLSKLENSEISNDSKVPSKAIEDIQRKVLNVEEAYYQQPQEIEKIYQEAQQYQQPQQYQSIQQAPEIQQIARAQRPPRQEVRFDDVNGIRTQRIQQQFNDLYGKNEHANPQTQVVDKTSQRREIIKKLLKDMNNSNTKTGSRI